MQEIVFENLMAKNVWEKLREKQSFVYSHYKMDEEECKCEGWRRCWACGLAFDECDC